MHPYTQYIPKQLGNRAGGLHESIKTNVMFNTTFSVLIFISVYSSIIRLYPTFIP